MDWGVDLQHFASKSLVSCQSEALVRLCPCGHMILCTAAAAAESLQSCLTLCNPIDGSLQGSDVPGIFQARILEWVAIAFSEIKRYTRAILTKSCMVNFG